MLPSTTLPARPAARRPRRRRPPARGGPTIREPARPPCERATTRRSNGGAVYSRATPCGWPGNLGTWNLGTWEPGNLGPGAWEPGTWEPGNLGTWEPGNLGTWGLGTWNLGTWVPGWDGRVVEQLTLEVHDVSQSYLSFTMRSVRGQL